MSDTTQFLHYRVEAMAKRIAELETENATLRKTMNLPIPASQIIEGIDSLKCLQMIGRGTRPKVNQEIINLGKIGEQTNVDQINGNITL